MRRIIVATASALALLAAPAAARSGKQSDDQPEKSQKAERPVTDNEVSAEDVVTTPATDLNLKKDEIPQLLLAAQEKPYVLTGLGTCRQLASAIEELDTVLGEDVDVPQEEGRRVSPGRMAQTVVGSFIPFRGLIREISGANAHERALQEAVIAGIARRSFLKGIGQAKGCRYPARSATLEVFNERMAALNEGKAPRRVKAAEAEPDDAGPDTGEPVRFVSRPVVQNAD